MLRYESNIPRSVFHNVDYNHFIVQYQGKINDEALKKEGYYIARINDKYAIISTKKDKKININDPIFSNIVYVKGTETYTLEEISPIDAAQVRSLQINLPLQLTGEGVVVGIIDTGIDYLSDEFMTLNGESRIECIWDQTIVSEKVDEIELVPYGALYLKDKINEAIRAYRQGKSPYDIVPSIDEIGHGTNMSGIIGATGKNPELKGVAPDCKFVVVKLIEDYSNKAQFKAQVPIFNITAIFSALEFLYEHALKKSEPMVIYLPLGSNSGNHRGNGILAEYIESISNSRGIVVVTGAGNERSRAGHASGVISKAGETRSIELNVSPNQKYLWVEIWVDPPNIMTVDIVSPSGENTGVVPAIINLSEDYNFIFEKTSIKIEFYIPEENTGDELIRIQFYDLQPGIWKIKLIANLVLDGTYNIWIPQYGLSVGDTSLSPSDPFGTFTNPGGSTSIITVASYNQNNNNIVNYSGMSFLNDYIDRVDIAAGGVNAVTVAPNNSTTTVNGTSVSAAVVAGTCAMLFQWGIVEGNDPYMYSQTIKTYLTRGTRQRPGDSYPNPEWGYGALDVIGIFANMT
ncbi:MULTISPECIES: S8 family peptidase [Clostridium]|uniref:S8 family peptidase n=1 Tax=Clostridium TaxID=1485 RepID=UPI0013CBDA7C|nr:MULTISPECIES: S8 family peptidase [Clostridium]MBN1041869.1 peptidase S8 [Clostridium botulinum]MBN1048528.1 peptidase S8 [Clostridium botulinum]MBY6915851.1 S8 family peptidase [Clostridium botulinum]MBY7026880.1 S8 family peptidase [Clostridium botulinum]NFH92048.1 peptidase S8 [Clostridium botulinum]